MRLSIALLLALAVAVALFAITRDDDDAARDTGALTLVGDSLNVGLEPYLADELPGWRIDAHDRVGRASREGVAEFRRLDGTLAAVVVVSLGTNDADGTEPEFRRLVDDAVEMVGPERCLVWATIVRDGVARTGFDGVLRDARSRYPNVRIVDWSSMVAQDPSLLASDAVHGTPEGYSRRAEETARVVRTCAT